MLSHDIRGRVAAGGCGRDTFLRERAQPLQCRTLRDFLRRELCASASLTPPRAFSVTTSAGVLAASESGNDRRGRCSVRSWNLRAGRLIRHQARRTHFLPGTDNPPDRSAATMFRMIHARRIRAATTPSANPRLHSQARAPSRPAPPLNDQMAGGMAPASAQLFGGEERFRLRCTPQIFPPSRDVRYGDPKPLAIILCLI